MANLDEVLRLKAQASQFRAQIAELQTKLDEARWQLEEAQKVVAQLHATEQHNELLMSENDALKKQLAEITREKEGKKPKTGIKIESIETDNPFLKLCAGYWRAKTRPSRRDSNLSSSTANGE